MVFTYELPFKIADQYRSLIQKQPGAQNWKIVTNVTGGRVKGQGESIETLLDGDKEVTVSLR